MNIFQLLVADPSKLTTAQQSLQRSLRTFIITVVSSIILQIAVLFQKNSALDIETFFLLLGAIILNVVGHAIEPVLLQQGVSQEDASSITSSIETASNTLEAVAKEENQNKNHS